MKDFARAVLACSVLGGLVGTAPLPASAADTCAEKIKAVKAEMDKATDAEKRAAAAGHYKMAEDAIKVKDDESCIEHLGMAEKALKENGSDSGN